LTTTPGFAATAPSLAERRLVIVGGKGGVGRTTIAAALALALARRGRRVLLAQTNAKERLSILLGTSPVGTAIARVRENLWAVNMTPQESLHEYGLMVLRFEAVYKAVLENRYAQKFVRAIPGLDEYSMLGKAWFHTTEELDGGEPRFHTVILDGPATGHLVAMLGIPQAILAAVPEGPLTRDARRARELLTDPKCTAALLVTLAEELPIAEVIDLHRAFETRLGIASARLVVNQLWPERFTRPGPATRALEALAATPAPTDPLLAPLVARAITTRERRRLNEQGLAVLAERLPLPQTHLPLLFARAFGAPEVDQLSRLLEEDL
jgi:anion-transporting  ArsA/GET3 family ATPase